MTPMIKATNKSPTIPPMLNIILPIIYCSPLIIKMYKVLFNTFIQL